jgi:uncharacterized membrane protein YedE/YeeE
MRMLSAAAFGLLFGLGLLVSGMTDPARIMGFLDVTGAWNPALMFVMVGAIAVAAPAFALARRSGLTVWDEPIQLPDRSRIDLRLIGGAAIFGVGWGLSGICPGPGVVLVGQDGRHAWTFLAAVIVGGWIVNGLAPDRAAIPASG